MRRLLLYLPVCLLGLPLLVLLILAHTRGGAQAGGEEPNVHLEVAPAPAPTPPIVQKKGELPDNAAMEKLAKDNPVLFMENCIARYPRVVKTGYSLTLSKQETIGDTEFPREVVEVCYRENPYSVFFNWKEGARKAERVLYVAGANKDKNGKSQLLARPKGAFARRIVGDVVAREVNGSEAQATSRYTLDDFGFLNNIQRTYREWKTGVPDGDIKVEYLGIQKVKELNDRPCWVLHSVNKTPTANGVSELTAYYDTETWFQAGSIIKDKDGRKVGEYYFSDVKLNPEFKPGQFEQSALK
jgi:outer membrane lipoprotein-sorting protein